MVDSGEPHGSFAGTSSLAHYSLAKASEMELFTYRNMKNYFRGTHDKNVDYYFFHPKNIKTTMKKSKVLVKRNFSMPWIVRVSSKVQSA